MRSGQNNEALRKRRERADADEGAVEERTFENTSARALARSMAEQGVIAQRRLENTSARARTRARATARPNQESIRVSAAFWSRSVVAQSAPGNPKPQTNDAASKSIEKYSEAMETASFGRFACSLCAEIRPKDGLCNVDLQNFTTNLRPYAAGGVFPEAAALDPFFLRGVLCSCASVHFQFPFIRSLCSFGVAIVCGRCNAALVKNKLPESAKVDFGCFPASFPQLRTVEMLAISRAFACAVVLKIKDGNDICAEALRGSTISFGHDADQSLLLSLPRRDLLSLMKLHFVGSKIRAESSLRPALLRDGALFRSEVVRQYLEFLVGHNFRYFGISIQMEEANIAQQVQDIVDGTLVVESSTVEEFIGDGSSEAVADKHSVLVLPAVLEPGTAAKQVVSQMRMSARGQPINEFEANDVLLSCAFPWLFPRGNVGPHVGPVPSWLRDHYFNFFDGRFERDLLFRLHNVSQMRRHAVARNVKLKGRAVDLLTPIISARGFDESLAHALANKKLPASIRLFESLLVGVRVAQNGIPFSESERHKGYVELLGKMRFHGLPTWFVTLTPSAAENEYALNFSSFAGDEFPLTEYEARLARVCSNPVAAAKFFRCVLESLFANVFLVPEATGKSNRPVSDAKNGPFGEVVCWHLVVENQKRGLLHAHIVLWTRFGPAQMDDAIRQEGKMPHWLKDFVDSVMCTTGSDQFWRRSNDLWDRKERVVAPALYARNISRDFGAVELEEAYQAVVHNSCLHRLHKPSCWKYSATAVCRYAKPERTNNGETSAIEIWPGGGGFTIIGDVGPDGVLAEPAPCSHLGNKCVCEDSLHRHFKEATQIIFPRRRVVDDDSGSGALSRRGKFVDDRILVPHNPVLTRAALCNNDVKMFGCVEQGFACGHYVSKYVSKAENGRGILGETVQHMIADVPLEKRSDNTTITNRIANAILSAEELYDTVASWILIGGRGVMASEKCWFVFPWAAVSEFKLQRSDNDSSDEAGSECSEVHLEDYIETIGEHLEDATADIFHPDGDMLPNENSDEETEQSIDSRPVPVAVPQHLQYLYRPRELEGLSLMEFSCCIMIQQTERKRDQGRQVPGQGRKRSKQFVYMRGPLKTSYSCVQRISSMTPILGGAPPPVLPQNPHSSSSKKRATRELFAAYYSLLIFPWMIPEEDQDTDDSRKSFVRPMTFDELFVKVNADKTSEDIVTRGRAMFIINCAHGLRLSRKKYSDIDIFRKAEAETKAEYHRIIRSDPRQEEEEGNFHAIRGSGAQVLSAAVMDIEAIIAKHSSHRLQKCGQTLAALAGNVTLQNVFPERLVFTLTNVRECLLQMTAFSAEKERLSFLHREHGHVHADISSGSMWRGLSQEQEIVAETIFKTCDVENNVGENLFFVHGPPGCGKSFLIKSLSGRIKERHGERSVFTLAPTGSAAANLSVGTMTIHSGLMINPIRNAKTTLSLRRYTQLQKRLAGARLVVIDEISMVSPELFSSIDARLQQASGNAVPFGGFCVVACGDFFQIRPVSGQTLLEAALAVAKQKMSPAATVGATLWQRFRLCTLSSQMRAADCPRQGALISNIRLEKKFNWSTFSAIEKLCAKDFAENPMKWSCARFISFYNAEVDAANHEMVKNFAKLTGQKVLWWKNVIPKLTAAEKNAAYEKLFRSRGWFCRGAPAIFLANVASAIGIVNGGSAEALEALVFSPGAVVPENIYGQALLDEEIEIEVPMPVAVVVRISSRGELNFPSLTAGTERREAVVPLELVKGELQLGRNKCTPMTQFPYELGFASTYHRCQGQTLNAVVLSMSGPLTFEMLLVGLSRVRLFADMRVLLDNIGDEEKTREKVTKLTPSSQTLVWFSGVFDHEGKRKYT